MPKSLMAEAAELGSPPRTTMDLPTVVMLWPDRDEGDGPMFWKVYHRRDDSLKAARSPKSVPSSVRPPNTYMTSSTRAAA